jgi:hypothetical protein
MKVARQGEKIIFSFPSLETTNLTVGHKMVTGFIIEDSYCQSGVAHHLGKEMGSGNNFEAFTNVWTLGRNGFPQSGQEFTLERRFTIFETDLPAQHMWSPSSGKYYRVLWTRTFQKEIGE